MSSTLFKTVFAGAVAAAALLLPVTAAQASVKHHPCDGPGFGNGGFFDDGFRDGGFFGDGFGPWGDDFGFPRPHRSHDTTVIVVVPQGGGHHRHHHKPASTGGNANAAGAGYHKPSAAANGGGYRKGA